ncbi:hypothetical protein J6590_091455 [Homalodisca vitripennis]|nr:hypothetical protein J6590_091455 [Homalodisca vitripennis]
MNTEVDLGGCLPLRVGYSVVYKKPRTAQYGCQSLVMYEALLSLPRGCYHAVCGASPAALHLKLLGIQTELLFSLRGSEVESMGSVRFECHHGVVPLRAAYDKNVPMTAGEQASVSFSIHFNAAGERCNAEVCIMQSSRRTMKKMYVFSGV